MKTMLETIIQGIKIWVLNNTPRRPSNEETLAVLCEQGIIDPVTNNTGEMYTDNNGKLYTL